MCTHKWISLPGTCIEDVQNMLYSWMSVLYKNKLSLLAQACDANQCKINDTN